MFKSINIAKLLAFYVLINLFFIAINPAQLYSAQQQVYLIKDSEIEDFLWELLSPILDVAGIDKKSLNIYVVNDSSANAFVAGGQNIFVNTGLLTLVSSYNEIAGVISHELGHITAGHLSRGDIAYSNASWLMLLGLAGILLTAPFLGNNNNGGGLDVIGFLAYSTIQATQGAVLSYSRSEESQADQIGLEYIKQTDYNPAGFYEFMKKLYDKENKAIYKLPTYALLTTHPLTQNRMKFIQDFIIKNPKHYVKNKELSTKLLNIQAKIKAYFGEANIYTKGSIPYIYYEAVKAYTKSDFDVSIKLLKDLLKNEPNNIYYKELLADCYFGNQKFDASISYYSAVAKKIKSNKDLMYYKIALAYFVENKNKEALNNLNLSLQINNKNPSAWHLKSLIVGHDGLYGVANLALAEKFYIMNDKQKATFFVNKALESLKNNSNDYIQARDLLNNLNYKN